MPRMFLPPQFKWSVLLWALFPQQSTFTLNLCSHVSFSVSLLWLLNPSWYSLSLYLVLLFFSFALVTYYILCNRHFFHCLLLTSPILNVNFMRVVLFCFILFDKAILFCLHSLISIFKEFSFNLSFMSHLNMNAMWIWISC